MGDEWTYRSFIQGRTAAAAIWTFDGLSEDLFPESKFPNGIPVEMTIEVFRTYKGNQEKGVAGTITLGNPKTDKQVVLRNFLAKKFATDVQMIPRSFITAGSDGRAETIDLFRDLVSDDGRLEIILQCLEPQPVLRHGPGRPVHPRRRQFVCLELLQGLPGNLAANGLGHQPGRDVQHFPQRPGCLAGDDVRRLSPGSSAATLSNWPVVRWWEAGRSNRACGSSPRTT